MADIKISALSQVSEVQSTDVVPVVSGNSTMKMTAAQIKDYCVGDLDVSDSAVAGSYVTAVSETDGEISVTREAADTTPIDSSTNMVTSGGVYTALSGKADTGTTLSDYGITDAYTSTQADSAISTAINALDVSDSAVAGNYITAVSETDGAISVTREAADATPTASSTKMVTSGGVKTALDNKVDWDDYAVNGAVNMMDSTFYSLSQSETVNSVTLTHNNDGTVSLSGTSSAPIYIPSVKTTLKAGSYKIKGAPTVDSNTEMYAVQLRDANENVVKIAPNGTEVTFTINTEAEYRFGFYIAGNVDTTGQVFYPMVCSPNYNGDYVPYAMSNKELTEEVAPMACTETTAGTYTLTATVDSDGKVTYSWA